jgi:hypothetical protein
MMGWFWAWGEVFDGSKVTLPLGTWVVDCGWNFDWYVGAKLYDAWGSIIQAPFGTKDFQRKFVGTVKRRKGR